MIIASNFKTNHTRASTAAFVAQVSAHMAKENVAAKVMLFPTATSLMPSSGGIVMGAQNAYPVAKGSFTGEIGTEQLDEFGIRSILIGHSERRHILGETQELVAKKYAFFKEAGYEITYCIGEPLDVRQKGLDAVMEYLAAQMEGIDASYENLIVAYEPVWAIGTGMTATTEDIKSTHLALKKAYGFTDLLYGGSVKVENVGEILATEGVDGVLIGTASWNADDFCTILTISNESKGE